MKAVRSAVLTVAALLLIPGTAPAHFALLAPPSALQTEDGGKGSPPCGDGIESNVVTDVSGGHALPIRLQEFVFHPGHYRIALSVNSRSELPPDPDVRQAGGLSIGASIQNPPRIPVLSDGLFAHDSPPAGDWSAGIVLPNIDCEKCTLQIIEFMADHSVPFFYHHCADLRIRADPSLPPADAAWPRANTAPGRQTSAALPHLADGGGWQTAITLVNVDTVPAPFSLRFWSDNGTPLELPLAGLGRLSAVSGTIPAGGSRTIQTDGSLAATSTGWAELASPQAVDGSAIFRFQNGQEASVPLLSGGGRRLFLPFEDGPGLSLGIALSNISLASDTTVSLTLRNEQGDVLSTPAPVSLPRRQHTSIVLAAPSGGGLPQHGVVEINSSNADLFVLGIRINNGALTSIRALSK